MIITICLLQPSVCNFGQEYLENLQAGQLKYWPIYDKSLKNVVRTDMITNQQFHKLSYNNLPLFVPDRINSAGRKFDALDVQTNNVQFTYEYEELSDQAYRNGFSIGFRGKIDSRKANSVYISTSWEIDGQRLEWNLGENLVTDPANDPFQVDTWQFYAISVEVIQGTQKQLNVKYYVDDKVLKEETLNVTQFKVFKFVLGDALNNNLLLIDDIIIYYRHLILKNLQDIVAADIPTLQDYRNIQVIPIDSCIYSLTQLPPVDTINIDLEAVEVQTGRGPQLEHRYTLSTSFTDFLFLQGDCYQFRLIFNGQDVSYNLDYQYPQLNILKFNIREESAKRFGCTEKVDGSLECNFEFQLWYNGALQYSNLIRSVVNKIDPDNVTNGLQVQVFTQNPDQVDLEVPGIETVINVCTDATCASYKTDLTLVKGQKNYVEFKVLTPSPYNTWYPVHKSVTIGGVEIVPDNVNDFINLDTPGRIVYEITPTQAIPSSLLVAKIKLSEILPKDICPGQNTTDCSGNGGSSGGGNNERRFLEQQVLQFENGDQIGKQIYIAIIDRNDSKKSEEKDNTGLIVGATLGGVALVSASITAVAFVVLKMKKLSLAAQAAKVTPVETINKNINNPSSGPQSTTNMWESQQNLQPNNQNNAPIEED